MEDPLFFTRPEKERKGHSSLKEIYERLVRWFPDRKYEPIVPELKFVSPRRSFLKEESLEDVLKQLVQDRPGLLRRLRVKRVRPEDFPLSLKQQYSKMLLMDEEFLKDFCKELEQYREDPEPSCVSMKSDRSMDHPLSFKQQHLKPEQDRADPPEPSCVSMKSDWSKDFPLDFKQQHSKPEQDRADPPEPSRVSMKSDGYKDFPPVFKWQEDISEPEQDRADPPEPSCVSMKSDRSMDHPLSFKQQHSKPEQDRADPPEPSCVSMKSDWSKDFPLDFKQQHSKPEQDRADPPEPSCVSMKSDWSKDFPLDFKQQHSKVQQETSDVSTGRHSPLDSTFMFLEENIVGFVKNELKKFKEMLSPDYPECPEDQCEDEGVVDEDEAQRRYGSALVLKMTLLFMKRMNLGELADSLEKRSVRLLDSVAESKRHNGAFTGLMSAVNMLFSTCFK